MIDATQSHYWWMNLTPEWKQAFAETVYRHPDEPTEAEIKQLFDSSALRFAGPTAPYPNMSFALTDLSGVAQLTNLHVLVATHHNIESLNAVSGLTKLKALFVNNNRLKTLEGVEQMLHLVQLYAQYNCIESIAPVQKLVHLKELYINQNCISSLDGLTDDHADTLEMFFCKPNDSLKQKEILRVEREIGIRCRNA